MRTFLLIILIFLLAWPVAVSRAMSSSNYAIPTDSMNGGGGDTSSSANFKIHDTAGQSVTGTTGSVNFGAEQGYRTQTANSVLSADFVDAGGASIAAPVAAFTSITSGAPTASGALATTASKIRVTNFRVVPTWSLTIAATAGPATNWLAGANTLGFDHPSGGNALSVNPAAAVIAPVGSLCTTADLTRGANATFDQGVIDSITLLTAGGSAMTGCAWDLTNINLLQTLPAAPTPGAYSLSMTITVA